MFYYSILLFMENKGWQWLLDFWNSDGLIPSHWYNWTENNETSLHNWSIKPKSSELWVESQESTTGKISDSSKQLELELDKFSLTQRQKEFVTILSDHWVHPQELDEHVCNLSKKFKDYPNLNFLRTEWRLLDILENIFWTTLIRALKNWSYLHDFALHYNEKFEKLLTLPKYLFMKTRSDLLEVIHPTTK